jgi:hypothetical protein
MDVEFSWKGKRYRGELKPVTGAASGNMYHLIVKGFYQGQLVKTDRGWVFSNQKEGIIPELSEYFGQAVKSSLLHGEKTSNSWLKPHVIG